MYTTLVCHIFNLGNFFENIDQLKNLKLKKKKMIFCQKITIVVFFGHSLAGFSLSFFLKG